ncbi:MAG TPA: sigma-70 family RNA polymerase sigma factor [Thermoanaerobaculia bacterium]
MTTNALESDVLLARGGDEAAFRRLVDRCANTVCSIALAIVRNVDASEDIAQEVFLAAWTGLKQLRSSASFLPWLRQITRNRAHQWHRTHAREVSDDAMLAAAVDARPIVADRLLADEKSRVILDVLDDLGEEAREVLLLYYREDQSAKQVAMLLGISEAAVRQRLSRSRAAVREEVLRRFADSVATTAPGVAFTATVATAITLAAQNAAAATFGSVAGGGLSLLGGAFGWAGVLLGMKALGAPFDEEEARRLRRFRNVVLLAITLGGLAVAANSASALRLLIAVQSLYLVLGLLYAVWLPKILQRRRTVLRKMIWRAAAAAIAGAVVMAALVIL